MSSIRITLDVYQMVERPSRPNSVQQMAPSGQYQDWQVPKPRQSQLQSASMSSVNAFGPQLNQLQTGIVTQLSFFALHFVRKIYTTY